MNIDLLRYAAEALDTALLEKEALKEVGDHRIEMVPDDDRIDVYYSCLRPLTSIKCSIVVASSFLDEDTPS